MQYLGEEEVSSPENTPYEGFGPTEWALKYISSYGGIAGDHHKKWVLDQVARILKGTPVLITLAKWSNGHREYLFDTGEPSKEYLQWVEDLRGDYDENEEQYDYEYDPGIAP